MPKHPQTLTIHPLAILLTLLKGGGVLELILADTGQEAGYTPIKSPVNHRADTQTQPTIHTYK